MPANKFGPIVVGRQWMMILTCDVYVLTETTRIGGANGSL